MLSYPPVLAEPVNMLQWVLSHVSWYICYRLSDTDLLLNIWRVHMEILYGYSLSLQNVILKAVRKNYKLRAISRLNRCIICLVLTLLSYTWFNFQYKNLGTVNLRVPKMKESKESKKQNLLTHCKCAPLQHQGHKT